MSMPAAGWLPPEPASAGQRPAVHHLLRQQGVCCSCRTNQAQRLPRAASGWVADLASRLHALTAASRSACSQLPGSCTAAMGAAEGPTCVCVHQLECVGGAGWGAQEGRAVEACRGLDGVRPARQLAGRRADRDEGPLLHCTSRVSPVRSSSEGMAARAAARAAQLHESVLVE